MRRFVLLFLMFVLPLSWTAAVAAGACAHEEQAATLVADADVHAASDAASSPPDDLGAPAGACQDCPQCQAGAPLGVVSSVVATFAVPGDPPTATRPGFLPEPPVEPFLRPPLPSGC